MTNLESLIESNAKAIEALTSDIGEMKRDRDLMYSTMRDLTDKIGTLVSTQTQSYDLMRNLDNRQNQLANQQKRTGAVLGFAQSSDPFKKQLIEIQKQSTRQQEQITEILSRLTDNEK